MTSFGFLSLGLPYPPPPAVANTIELPFDTVIVSLDAKLFIVPSRVINVQEDVFPPFPPNNPQGDIFCRSDINVTVNPSPNSSISRNRPRPPRYFPAPPLPSIN